MNRPSLQPKINSDEPNLARRRAGDGGVVGEVDTRPPGSLVYHLVDYQDPHLDRVFSALGDPTRRAIIARLEQEESLSITEIAEPFKIKYRAVIKHLGVLSDAGLITRSKHGRTVDIRLQATRLQEATEWLRRYERFWTPTINRLAVYAKSKEAEAAKNDAEKKRGK
jgi:DNA-binding transcriptional ArsR family regulator